MIKARRRRRLIEKLNRAFWNTARMAMREMSEGKFDTPYYTLNGDLHGLLKSLERGESL